jgi:hypothetical protein
MPQEVRHIFFSREEVSTAITLYKQHRGELFVHHSVRMAGTRDEPNVGVRVLDEDGNESWLGGSALAAALIRCCIKERIPLPASAHKMIRAVPDGIALILIGGTSSDHVRSYVLGERLTMADIPFGPMIHRYLALEVERPDLPHIRAWHARLCERPAFREHVRFPFGSTPAEWYVLERAGAPAVTEPGSRDA